mmetsp:Transcript_37689/g.94609  ORF Transcript_37689/g.94609 Transcript_37689/m.94609 type:complete len:229 (-) Transcript_37689:569-1255(-)
MPLARTPSCLASHALVRLGTARRPIGRADTSVGGPTFHVLNLLAAQVKFEGFVCRGRIRQNRPEVLPELGGGGLLTDVDQGVLDRGTNDDGYALVHLPELKGLRGVVGEHATVDGRAPHRTYGLLSCLQLSRVHFQKALARTALGHATDIAMATGFLQDLVVGPICCLQRHGGPTGEAAAHHHRGTKEALAARHAEMHARRGTPSRPAKDSDAGGVPTKILDVLVDPL